MHLQKFYILSNFWGALKDVSFRMIMTIFWLGISRTGE